MYLPGRILVKRAVSPTVTLLDLSIPNLEFQPGQWLDFRIPTADWIGGFSIASSRVDPHLGSIQIAVKRSETHHKPAQWVTNDSQVDDNILVQVGGKCLLNPSQDKPAVFVAGGIGISPLLGMYRQYVAEERPAPVQFFYSVSTQEEVVFETELLELLHQRQDDSLTITLTQSSAWKEDAASPNVVHQVGRTLTEFLTANTHQNEESIFYVCGPPSMQNEALEQLRRAHIPEDRLIYEQWW